MTEPPTGRHRPVADRPEPEHRGTARGWIVTGLLVAAAVGAAVVAIATNDPPLSPTAAPTAAATPSTTPLSPEPTELAVTVLVAQTCGRLGVEPTADGVWDAAAALEVGPNALSTDDAWALVDLAARLDCPQYAALVDATIASVGG